MPEGWMVGRDGKPMTDPTRQKEGLLLPIGGPKGYGLAMAIGLLAGTLNGAAFGKDVVEFTTDTQSPTNTGQFVAAISLSAFGDTSFFKSAVDAVFQDVKSSTPLPGGDPIRIPGENRQTIHDDRLANGVPLHANLLAALNSAAGELQITPLVI
jgi:LDH2 family malate/lactate/ureidoglycolate dehydrogenase